MEQFSLTKNTYGTLSPHKEQIWNKEHMEQFALTKNTCGTIFPHKEQIGNKEHIWNNNPQTMDKYGKITPHKEHIWNNNPSQRTHMEQ